MNSWTLAIAVEKQIPLKQTIASLAVESSLLMRGRLWRLFSHIDSGARFEDAICGVPQVIPRFALPLFRIGCLSGHPSLAMQVICSQDDNENYKLNQTLLGRLFYLLVCYLFMAFVFVFILFKIVPAFQKIFEDFGTSMCLFMKVYINISYFVYTYWYLFFFPFVLPILLFIPFCFYVMLRLSGVVAFDLPGTAWFMRKFHRARIQESLALAIECKMPLNEALRELALFYPTFGVRRLLWQVSDRVNDGYDWKQELRKVRLLSQTEYAVAESAEATGDLPWTLRLLAEKRAATHDILGAMATADPFCRIASCFRHDGFPFGVGDDWITGETDYRVVLKQG